MKDRKVEAVIKAAWALVKAYRKGLGWATKILMLESALEDLKKAGTNE